MGAEGSVSVPGGSPPANPGAGGGDRGGMDVVASVNRRRKDVCREFTNVMRSASVSFRRYPEGKEFRGTGPHGDDRDDGGTEFGSVRS